MLLGFPPGTLAKEPSSSSKIAKQALAARNAGQTEHSIELYRLALDLNPDDPKSWFYQGLNFYDLNRYADCEKSFLNVIERAPDNGGAYAFLGLCEVQTKKYATAFSNLVFAQQKGIYPGTDLAKIVRYYYIALANKLGQFELSAGLLAEVVKNPKLDLPNLADLIGLSTLRLRLLPKEIPRAKKEPVLMAGRSVILAWTARVPEAMAEANALLAKYPKLPNVHYLKGYLYLQMHSDRAIPEFKKELETSPNHVQARLQIAYEYLQRGELAKGLPYAAKAVKLAPADFTAHDIYGRLLLDAGHVDAAIAELRLAVKLAPTSPDAHFHLSAALARAGRKQEAANQRRLFIKFKKAIEKQRGSTLPQQKRN